MLHSLVEHFESKQEEVLAWVKSKKSEIKIPVYASCDVRNSGFKLTVVDTNLFPAGWNNLCPSYAAKASEQFKEYLGNVGSVAVLAEEHTRNKFYFSNLLALQNILIEAGFRVWVVNPALETAEIFKTAEDEDLKEYTLAKVKESDLILLNNDLSDGVPSELETLEKPILPGLNLGWHKRRKSDHFIEFNQLADELAKLIDFDPWYLKSDFETVDGVDINKDEDKQRLANKVDELLARISKEYKERGIDQEPVAFIKNDSGTYGMGVISVKSGQEVMDLNRKNRNKLSVGKGNVAIRNFLIQEGVPTSDKIKGKTAEPVIYIAGGKTAGGFFRVNESKGENDNLNSPGMKFVKLCFDKVLGYENESASDCDLDCLNKLYQVVANLATLAAGRELSV